MEKVEFGREKYHLQSEMSKWCRDNIGEGGWLANDKSTWSIDSMFGYTTFTFNRPEDLTIFLLRWA